MALRCSAGCIHSPLPKWELHLPPLRWVELDYPNLTRRTEMQDTQTGLQTQLSSGHADGHHGEGLRLTPMGLHAAKVHGWYPSGPLHDGSGQRFRAGPAGSTKGRPTCPPTPSRSLSKWGVYLRPYPPQHVPSHCTKGHLKLATATHEAALPHHW